MNSVDREVIIHNIKQISGWRRYWYLWRYWIVDFLYGELKFNTIKNNMVTMIKKMPGLYVFLKKIKTKYSRL